MNVSSILGYINFPLLLTSLVFISGFIVLIDKIWLAPKRLSCIPSHQPVKESIWIEYAHSFFPILLFVLVFRSFLAEPFRIPSGSLEPTLLPGDFIVVNKFIYGLRLPVTDTVIFEISKPKRGDIVVFRWPPDNATYFIKRVIGIPRDKIMYKNKTLFINGSEVNHSFKEHTYNLDNKQVERHQEQLGEVNHDIYIHPVIGNGQDFEVVVPEGQYFAMGDNRDFSSDSRFWGFVPYENIAGKAFGIVLSWDSVKMTFRWIRTVSPII